ncbi:MAG: M23 family metallopeptidase [Deltaproteobacteria bacterium]|nr:M23 family metallopeptidase [Deltaproteobacteria bacterium]MBM4295552.1 M23 family metallopeptidase [Deltaproteobacteria bacterium]
MVKLPKLKKAEKTIERQTRLLLVNLVRGALVILILWLIVGNLDWYDPWLSLKPEISQVGARTEFLVEAGDKDAGIKKVRVAVKQGDQEKEVLSRTYPSSWGIFGSKGSEITKVEVPFVLEAKALGLQDGKATLLVEVWDRSWRNYFQGRHASLSLEMMVDLVPLKLTFQSVNHLLHSGGAGVICYRLSKAAGESGVLTGGVLYKGFPNPKGPEGEYVCLFPVSRESSGTAQVDLVARSASGSEVRHRVSFKVKPRKWRQDRMNLSEDFLRQVAATFSVAHPGDLVAAYLEVNRELRRKNHDQVRQVCSQSQPQTLWSGAFQRLLGKPMARFGDKRAYFYQGRQIDQQVHLGEDLASLEKSPVPAGNRGVAVLAEPLGIYGQTVILDHGLGVFSMYSHLSQIDVQKGDKVEKGATVGRTGATGLAGGDHLHFSMILQGEFVDPVEWWDPHWHKDQMEGQWARAATSTGEPVKAAAARPGKAGKAKGKAKPAKSKKKR